MTVRRVRVLGLGGTHRPGSSSELSVRFAVESAHHAGADVRMVPARALDLPFYGAGDARTEAERELLDAIRWADGLIIGSPGYHGTVSGLLKNALRTRRRRPVGRPRPAGRRLLPAATALGPR